MKNILYYCDDLDLLEKHIKIAEGILRNLSRKKVIDDIFPFKSRSLEECNG